MTIKSKTIDCHCVAWPTCPRCGHAHKRWQEYGFDLDGDQENIICSDCENEFKATMHIDVSFTSEMKK